MVVVGRGVVEAAPDVAVVQVGVTVQARSAAAAIDSNSAAARRVIDQARAAGVESADIGTASVQLSPNFKTVQDSSGAMRQQPDGYTASNTVQVRLRDLAKVGGFARDVVDQGANRIDGIQFGLLDPNRAADEARDAAVADAVRQAQRLAAAAGIGLGRIETIASPPRGNVQPLMERGPAAMAARSAKRGPVPVEAGSIEVSAEVEITWSLQ
jgi:uncharacterized protein YggE